MAGVCQIVLRELPYVPAELSGVELFTLFMRTDEGHPCPPTSLEDRGWEIRTYSDLADVVAVEGPSPSRIKPAAVRWEAVVDLPAREDAARVLSDEVFAEIDDEFHDLAGGPADGFKVGGWPYLVQSEIYWAPRNQHPAEPEYVLQIDSDEKTGLAWGDFGVLYVGRGAADPSTWALEWQCM